MNRCSMLFEIHDICIDLDQSCLVRLSKAHFFLSFMIDFKWFLNWKFKECSLLETTHLDIDIKRIYYNLSDFVYGILHTKVLTRSVAENWRSLRLILALVILVNL